ncbi:hypothetical protein PV325_009149 [Microctonus aethiopoides]|nr:hypothetical protein PV325_009149 [Microctonus aethiopoides]KAK0098720.1 hypothetical protein PV326_004874 [Microctonus aethiopoides]
MGSRLASGYGRTHDSTYSLYRLGERLTPGATQYVETGRTDGLDTGGDNPNILDAFGAPGVPQGEGTTVSRAFFDGNHTLVSVMARINPSPDWFIGVDSFQLCVEGNWVDTVTVELDPLDGGTDNGFTFTAANWPTNPQGIAYRITSRYPAHPAGSFYYPNLPRLPPIATLTFTKVPSSFDWKLLKAQCNYTASRVLAQGPNGGRQVPTREYEANSRGHDYEMDDLWIHTCCIICPHTCRACAEVDEGWLLLAEPNLANPLLKEYTLTETYHEDEVEMEFVSNDKHLQSYSSSPRGIDPNRELNEAIAEERREMDSQKYRYWTTGSSPSSSSSSGLLSSGESENSRMAIINSIASSYGNYGQSRSRLLSTPTPFPRLANSQENRSKQEATLYKSADALVEAQKAQIYEDIQRRIANVTSSSLNRRIWRNNSTIINNRERQHKLRMKHHRYSIKGKRNRGSESLFVFLS